MRQETDVALIQFSRELVPALVPMWRASFERAVGITDPHPIAEQIEYLLSVVVPNNDIRAAVANDVLVGFVAASPESIAQLYVHVDYQRRGIGTKLLQWAKDQSHGSLWLYTFERNHQAQRFYEQHGFTVVARGIEQQWQLPDIKYQWVAPEM